MMPKMMATAAALESGAPPAAALSEPLLASFDSSKMVTDSPYAASDGSSVVVAGLASTRPGKNTMRSSRVVVVSVSVVVAVVEADVVADVVWLLVAVVVAVVVTLVVAVLEWQKKNPLSAKSSIAVFKVAMTLEAASPAAPLSESNATMNPSTVHPRLPPPPPAEVVCATAALKSPSKSAGSHDSTTSTSTAPSGEAAAAAAE